MNYLWMFKIISVPPTTTTTTKDVYLFSLTLQIAQSHGVIFFTLSNVYVYSWIFFCMVTKVWKITCRDYSFFLCIANSILLIKFLARVLLLFSFTRWVTWVTLKIISRKILLNFVLLSLRIELSCLQLFLLVINYSVMKRNYYEIIALLTDCC